MSPALAQAILIGLSDFGDKLLPVPSLTSCITTSSSLGFSHPLNFVFVPVL